jgi:hypothetical protein
MPVVQQPVTTDVLSGASPPNCVLGWTKHMRVLDVLQTVATFENKLVMNLQWVEFNHNCFIATVSDTKTVAVTFEGRHFKPNIISEHFQNLIISVVQFNILIKEVLI